MEVHTDTLALPTMAWPPLIEEYMSKFKMNVAMINKTEIAREVLKEAKILNKLDLVLTHALLLVMDLLCHRFQVT